MWRARRACACDGVEFAHLRYEVHAYVASVRHPHLRLERRMMMGVMPSQMAYVTLSYASKQFVWQEAAGAARTKGAKKGDDRNVSTQRP